MVPEVTTTTQGIQASSLFVPPTLEREPSDPLQLSQFLPDRMTSPLPMLTQKERERFIGVVHSKSQRSFERIRKQLEDVLKQADLDLGQSDEIALAMDGSDGRGENPHSPGQSFSPIELVICSGTSSAHLSPDPQVVQEKKAALAEKVAKIEHVIHTNPQLHQIFYPFIERKSIEEGHVSTLALPQGKEKVIPTRVYDLASLQMGNPKILEEVEEKLIHELREEQVSIGDFNRDFVAQERRNLTAQLGGRQGLGVDISTGSLLFDPTSRTNRGPKYGPMRYLQYSVALFVSRHLKALPPTVNGKQFLEELPKFLIERVRFLKDRGVLSFSEAEFALFQDVYSNLLFWYATLQWRAFHSEPKIAHAKVDPEILRGVLMQALELGNKIVALANEK